MVQLHNKILVLVFVCLNLCGFFAVFPADKTPWTKRNKSQFWENTAHNQGPNICASEKIVGSTQKFGRPWTGGQMCGLPSVVVFECCQGYGLMVGEPGCSVVKPLSSIWNEVSSTKASRPLLELLQNSGLTVALSKEGPFTLFAPIAFALTNATDEVMAALNRTSSLRTSRSTSSVLLYHVVEGRYGEDDFKDNMLIPTLYHKLPLRFNRFPNGLLTVNCVPLVQLNREATNGMIHTVKDVLMPPSQSTIMDVLLRDGQFGRLSNALVKTKMASLLREPRMFTIFAPTNEAFDSLARENSEAIHADHDALTALLKYHILQEVWCSTSVAGDTNLTSLEGSTLQMSCNDSTVFINEAVITKRDIIASNGIIQVIDKVLFPRKAVVKELVPGIKQPKIIRCTHTEAWMAAFKTNPLNNRTRDNEKNLFKNIAKSLMQLLEELSLTEVFRLVNVSGLKNIFVNGAKFTIFAPSDHAFQDMSSEALALLTSDPSRAYNLLVGHMVTGSYRTTHLADKMLLPTLAQMRPLQVNIYPQKILIDGGVILKPITEGRNGVIHIIDHILTPPSLSIGQLLQDNNNLSTFCNALNNTVPNLLNEVTFGEGPFTVFAPDEEAFQKLPEFTVQRMLSDTSILTRIVTNHILDEQVLTKGLLPKAYYQYKTRHGIPFKIREDTGLVTAGIAIIKEADILCTNGVLHIVDRMIQFL